METAVDFIFSSSKITVDSDCSHEIKRCLLCRRKAKTNLLLLLSHFSCVRLCVTPQTAATRLPRPWDSPGKNTGVGCHFLLQCMKVKSESEVPESSLTLSHPMDCGPPGSSVHGIFQAKDYWSGVSLPSPYTMLLLLLLSRFSRVRLCATP